MKKSYLFVFLLSVYTSVSAQWSITQEMSETRTQHVAVALNSDEMLVAGGYDFTTNLATSEVYNRFTDTWTPTTNNMSSAHSTAAAVLLANGKVLVIGGWDGSINTTVCDLYDPGANSWSATGYLAYGRSYHTATLLDDGRVLVTGGYTGATNTPVCEIYDPVTGTWSQTDSLAIGRSYHTATKLQDGRVLVAGGYNPSAGFQLSSVEIFDPVTNTWNTSGSMADARAWHSASLLPDGRVMVAGGEFFTGGTPYAYEGLASAEAFDPTSGTWTNLADMPGGLSYNQQFTLSSGEVLVVAGASQTDYGSGFTYQPGATYLYQSSGNTWTSAAMNIDGRMQFAAASMNGFPMVTGGEDATCEIFQLGTGITESNLEKQVNVFPNPASDFINLVVNNGNIQSVAVFDLWGKQVFSRENINTSNYRVTLYALSKGMYTVKVKTTEGTIQKKITVVK